MPTVSSPLLVANWKMNLSLKESVLLTRAVLTGLAKRKSKNSTELVLCPSFPALSVIGSLLKAKKVTLGAQDVFWKTKGPYTGEVSVEVLKELGVRYVIIGHSERRQYLRESDGMVQQKVATALQAGLTPIICVGETFAERQVGQKDVVVARQVTAALSGLTLAKGEQVVVAYEPVWVIGSGQAVEPEEAFHSARVIRQALIDLFPSTVARTQIRLIYGGSVDTSNISSFISNDISGVLVGGASLEAKRLLSLIAAL